MGTDRATFPYVDEQAVLAGIRAALRLAGEDSERSGLVDTPQRWLKAWLELTGRPGDPEVLLGKVFDDVGTVDQMVTVGPIPFSSLCEHHLLPFTGHAFIAYIPTSCVVGLSKIPRLVEHYARRLQVQERLTGQITAALDTHLAPAGSAALVNATHSCSTLRGIRTPAPMTTTSLTGAFREDPAARAEFLAAARWTPTST